MSGAKHIGKLIREVRKSLGLKPKDLGRRCNVTRSRIYQWEKQKYILPKNFGALSMALGIPVDRLIRENGVKPNKKTPRCLILHKRRFVPAVPKKFAALPRHFSHEAVLY